MADIRGAAQSPRTFPWSKNPDGPRTLEQALAIARSHGVIIPEDVVFMEVSAEDLPVATEAVYFSRSRMTADEKITWSQFYNNLTKKIPVRVSRSVLESDEAIVAVFAHEMYELNALRELFGASGNCMTSVRLYELVSWGRVGNLHDQAWDVADELVAAMRRQS
jgi:hypothetical protein